MQFKINLGGIAVRDVVELEFKGYRREMAKEKTPLDTSGVFCVYRAAYNSERNSVKLREIIYIGEGENVRDAIVNNEMLEVWKKHLKNGEELCYSYVGVEEGLRKRIEAALIYKHKPILNGNYKRDFPFETISVATKGKNALLMTTFRAETR